MVPEGIDPKKAINKGIINQIDTYNVPPLENRWDPENDDFKSFSIKTF